MLRIQKRPEPASRRKKLLLGCGIGCGIGLLMLLTAAGILYIILIARE